MQELRKSQNRDLRADPAWSINTGKIESSPGDFPGFRRLRVSGICIPSCTARCMTVYLIYRSEKVVEVVRKIARVKFLHDFT